MAEKKERGPKHHKFRDKLILNQWLMTLFGIDPLKEGDKRRPFHKLADLLKDPRQEGIDKDNLHHFYHDLVNSNLFWNDLMPLSREQLLVYEENIARHTQTINEKRHRPVVWKYFQWLSLLFVEIYLDRYFSDRESLLRELNDYVTRFNNRWIGYVGVAFFNEDELNKLSLQNATGSGKTLLMHVNYLQYKHYAKKYGKEKELSRVILITPNERLSEQHIGEFSESNIRSSNFSKEGHGLFTLARGLNRVDVLEITKLGDKEGPNTIATRTLGDQNLLLVDEGHRGLSGKNAKADENAWYKNRAMLCEKGFTFEYSATFDQAVSGTGHEDDYARTVIFDYSYRWFYEDGFGKDYQILNLPKSFDETKAVYLTACLLKVYQQLDIYEEKSQVLIPFNIEKPLWVFVGNTVTGGSLGKDEQIVAADVAQIIAFVADFLAGKEKYCKRIEAILTGNGQSTGLLDSNGVDIFEGAFNWLAKSLNSGRSYEELYKNILSKLFNTASGGHLILERFKGESGEISMRAGTSETPFGLINVGDAKALADHIEMVAKADGLPLSVTESDFSQGMFETVRESSSPVNLLIGSKKFVEGWDCWRVSTLGLMHVGKSEGAQIIQLFGRGVRLKGYNWGLKRSGHSNVPVVPQHIEELETLNVFGIEADFMEKFRQFLADEGLPGNERRRIFTIPLNVTYDFGKKLQIIRPKRKADDGREYDFKKDAPVPTIGQLTEYLRLNPIVSDWYPRIQSIQSKKTSDAVKKDDVKLGEKQLSLLNIDELYFALEQYKRERSWYNLNIDKAGIQRLLKNNTWYKLFLPTSRLEPAGFDDVNILQQVASELLKRYCEHYYNYCKRSFIEPRLELRELTPEDDNIPLEKDFYQLIVDGSEEQVILSIEKLKKELKENKKTLIEIGNIKACRFGMHLFQPLFHVKKGGKITILPVALNESEFQFVEDLKTWVEKNNTKLNSDGSELFLLRNLSRGKGVGFFEAGNFHPDFILWMIKDEKQYVTFIEPHGLIHEGPASDKVQFHKRIKEIEKRFNRPDIILNSFILSWTPHPHLRWGISQTEMEANHVLFMTDDRDGYINKMFEILM